MASVAEQTLHTLFKRCVLCPSQTPSCPNCPGDQICSLQTQTCDACAQMICIANPSASPPSTGPNVGAVAGGVIGGLAFVLIVVTLLWRFSIRKRRAQQELEAEAWEEDDVGPTKSGSRFNMRSDAASTRTRASLAHSFLSRASNIIQIAYFPGVTNRSESAHNSMLSNVPVPPIPAAYAKSASKSPLSNQGDALFFRPGDLRDSTYSSASSLRSGTRDTRYTMHSITPSLARSSMASEIYHDDATVEPMPATTITRALPRMVSVKSSQTSSPTNSMTAPEHVPIDYAPDHAPHIPRGISGGSVVKSNQTNIKSRARFPVRPPSDASSAMSARYLPIISTPLIEMSGESESEEEEHLRMRQSLLKDSGSPNSTAASTPIMHPAEVDINPFFDTSELAAPASTQSPPPPQAAPSSSSFPKSRLNPYAAMSASVGASQDPRTHRAGDRPVGGLSAVIEEATKRASRSQGSRDDTANARRDLSPFSDVHVAP